MLFSGIPFLYYFLPCTLILYFLSPTKLKNTTLLIASLIFYAWGEPKYVFLMAITILVGYVFGILIEKYRATKRAKVYLFISAFLSLISLLYFKYADFFIENFALVTGLSVKILGLALPIGISFYTFQIISYSVDVYRGDVAQKNPVNLAAYVTMFSQLIAGPIVRYRDIAEQLESRKHSVEGAAFGIRRFILGLAKKILIANQLGELCAIFRGSDEKSVLFYWLYAVSFCLHIYFDFSGYSDMAIGLGKIFAFDFIENFNYPYISKSVAEFWRRWHISLGSWFRDYVYIPLGGNKVRFSRWIFNILVVWMLTGFWHGASWNFIIWGLYFAVLLIAEKLFLSKLLSKSKIIANIYVLFAVLISFVIFNASDMGEALSDIGGLFGVGASGLTSAEALYMLKSYSLVIFFGIIGATPLPKYIVSKINIKVRNSLEVPILALLLIIMTAFLVDGSFNPFLYFRF